MDPKEIILLLLYSGHEPKWEYEANDNLTGTTLCVNISLCLLKINTCVPMPSGDASVQCVLKTHPYVCEAYNIRSALLCIALFRETV